MTRREVFGSASIEVAATIRACREDDLPALEWMGLYAPHREIIRQAFEAQQRGDALLLLAIAADFPIGQVWIDFARKRADRAAVLWAVRTFYPLQGAGLGRHLMEAAEAALKERGVHRAELEVERHNERALRFYRKLGWRIAGPLTESLEAPAPHESGAELGGWLMAKDLPPA